MEKMLKNFEYSKDNLERVKYPDGIQNKNLPQPSSCLAKLKIHAAGKQCFENKMALTANHRL